jgi:hypothetical protein
MKLQKNVKKGVLTAGLHLAPHKSSGWNVCPFSTAGCRSVCLGNRCGGFRFAKIKDAQIERTRLFFEERDAFLRQLAIELKMLEYEADLRGMQAAARLNVVSDILWEDFLAMEDFPAVKFYDYTKHPLKNRRPAANYHLVFSIAETTKNWTEAKKWLAAGHNAAMVVAAKDSGSEKEAKAVIDMLIGRGEVLGYPCVRGDEDDLRFYEGAGKIVLLYPKGSDARADDSGFVHRFKLEKEVTV